MPAYLDVSALAGQPAAHTALVLHGILGSANNWRSFFRRLAAAHPTWRFLLADLRNHGDSQGAPAPHTLATCAGDLGRLMTQVGVRPTVVCGHSFGGKVALSYAADVDRTVREVWLLDAPPSALDPGQPGAQEIERVIATLGAVELPIASRAALVELLKRQGISEAIAQWMTTNLKRATDGYVWRFNLAGIVEMMADYAARDLWPSLVGLPDTMDAHLVRGGRSDRWRRGDLERLATATTQSHIHAHVLADAGHWLHADDPEGLGRLLDAALTRTTCGDS